MHGKCVCEDSRLFPQPERNVFSRSCYLQKKKKIKGHVIVYLLFSVVTFFMLIPAFLQTLQCVLLPVG